MQIASLQEDDTNVYVCIYMHTVHINRCTKTLLNARISQQLFCCTLKFLHRTRAYLFMLDVKSHEKEKKKL